MNVSNELQRDFRKLYRLVLIIGFACQRCPIMRIGMSFSVDPCLILPAADCQGEFYPGLSFLRGICVRNLGILIYPEKNGARERT